MFKSIALVTLAAGQSHERARVLRTAHRRGAETQRAAEHWVFRQVEHIKLGWIALKMAFPLRPSASLRLCGERIYRFSTHAIALTLVAIFAPASHAALTIQNWVAPSGARVLFVENHALPILDVDVSLDAGSARDPAGKSGLAALTHGLLDSGVGSGKTALSESAISDRFADTGAQSMGRSEADRVSVGLRVLSNAEERDGAVDLLCRILTQPAFPKAVLERERKRGIAELREALTQPEAQLSRRFAQLTYGNHPYGQRVTEASLTQITRDDIVKFYRTHYLASAATVTLVGDLTRVQAEALAQQLTADLPRGAAPSALPDPIPPKGVVEHIKHAATQAHVAIGMPALKRGDPDFFSLVVGNYALGGGGFVSRLMKEVRDARGLSYDVSSYFMPQASLGLFQIGLGTKAEKADEAVKVATDVLNTFLRDGPTDEELTAAKANIINGFSLRLDDNRKILEQVAVIGFYRLPLDWLDRYTERVNAVTTAQIKAAFPRHVKPESLVTVVVGAK